MLHGNFFNFQNPTPESWVFLLDNLKKFLYICIIKIKKGNQMKALITILLVFISSSFSNALFNATIYHDTSGYGQDSIYIPNIGKLAGHQYCGFIDNVSCTLSLTSESIDILREKLIIADNVADVSIFYSVLDTMKHKILMVHYTLDENEYVDPNILKRKYGQYTGVEYKKHNLEFFWLKEPNALFYGSDSNLVVYVKENTISISYYHENYIRHRSFRKVGRTKF